MQEEHLRTPPIHRRVLFGRLLGVLLKEWEHRPPDCELLCLLAVPVGDDEHDLADSEELHIAHIGLDEELLVDVHLEMRGAQAQGTDGRKSESEGFRLRV